MGQSVKNPTGTVANSTLSKRRRFQPPITNFFATTLAESESESVDGLAVTHNNYSATTFSPTPVLPETVQKNLFDVGWRVRKAMAEGYKTQRSMKAEKAQEIVTPTEPRVALSSLPPNHTRTLTHSHTHTDAYAHTPRRAELAPFSGLSKATHDPYSVMTDDGDAFSLPPSSQESISSTDSCPGVANAQKRALVFEDDHSLDDPPISSWPGRAILSPRGRLSTHPGSTSSNMDGDDFEEASFLRQREEVDSEYMRMDFA
ncbi:hypothetical protein POX_c03860 [Penicillium oxalicum]|uniref:hypothetical protein n=1 Tax=Penicillium oxalicum TaxID=69781 RepID=UPI0020B7A47C|nr:hypothetical protein POX_c03860 [Penicillium oxalicum]KAI2791006.1 hypothetical protein POX_c03860 [Penicillium oxalicum]